MCYPGCVNNWLAGGASYDKINIGFVSCAIRVSKNQLFFQSSHSLMNFYLVPTQPFYGRSFLKAEHLYEPHEGNDDTTWWMDEGVPQCKSE